MNPTVNYSTILDNRVKDIFAVVAPTVPEEFMQYTTKVDDKQLLHTTEGITGLAMGEIIADGQVPTSDAPIQGFLKTYTQQVFSKRIRLSMKSMYFLFENGQDAKIKSTIENQVLDVKNAIIHTKNYLAQSMVYNGILGTSFSFTPLGGLGNTVTVDTTGIDGVAAFSAAHPREDGGASWTSLVTSGTVNPTFSFTALMAARDIGANKKDGRGLPISYKYTKSLFLDQSQSYFLAVSINATLKAGKYPSAILSGGNVALGTPTSLVDAATTAAFDIVPLMRYGGTGWTSIAWALFDPTAIDANHGLLFIESMPVTLITAQDAIGGLDYVKTAITYCQFGFADMRPWMVSDGLNS
jgi:hypothetical protein